MTEPNGPDPALALRTFAFWTSPTSSAGPAATMALAFMGAEVIKVERAGVEPAQAPLNRLIVNSNKKSITLDLKSQAGHDTVLDSGPASATSSSKTSALA